MSVGAEAIPFGGRTAWARNLAAPVRSFLSTEEGGAFVMLGAAIAALLWANSPWWHSYESVWTTSLSIRVGSAGIAADMRTWVNEGLMTLFFLVVGLEAKRQLDLGELRERRRLAIPVFAAMGGIVVPIVIYLAFNAGRAGAHGWGAAMSSDTAFALAAVALITPRTATRIRVFLLTLAVVDDLAALVVIATVYTTHVSVVALAVAVALFGVLVALRYIPFARSPVSIGVAVAIWIAMFKSGIDPVISGLAIGLGISAYPPSREDLERATALTRSFREQPTPELARSAQQSLQSAISPNERLQYELHPWTSYLIVPLFALANAGIHLTSQVVSAALSSPITWGILLGYVVGKPIGVFVGSWIATRPALHGPRSPVSEPVLLAAGACAGIGFTVSLLVSSLAFTGIRLDEARLGALASVVLAPAMAWIVTQAIRRLPEAVRARQVGRTAEDILDLAVDVDPEYDHIRGPDDAPVTLVEYGDFQCPYCGQAENAIRELLASHGDDIRYVWRHLPLNDVHPNAQLAAEAAEAAAAQGRFWEMYDTLLAHQGELTPRDLVRHAADLGLDADHFRDELRRREYAGRVSEDVASADESGVSGTPTFFINGRRHYGVYDLDTLTEAVGAAKRRARQLAATAALEETAR
ncbi:MAG: Na+/H+ antiporter NhaA [Solirubrobacterales bacterium]|nr:Na+/H+ antiporter NhaA [Solirubrobacterales bacterium]MBV9366186.1 Na+/H+ antiporter NhaA [Solirubrobacterales bacterium]